MRGELRTALQKGDTDAAVLRAFQHKYGAAALAEPTVKLTRTLFWAGIFVTLGVFVSILVGLVRKQQSGPVAATIPFTDLRDIDIDEVRQRVQEEIEKEDD
jgi:cytochrome c-type biogenesis protein CcmH/NrfF